MDELIHDKLIHKKCHPKPSHSDIKYCMTLIIMFSVVVRHVGIIQLVFNLLQYLHIRLR